MSAPRSAGPRLVLAVLMALCAGLLLYLGRGLTFFFDEWDFVQRRAGGVESLLEPHNEHLSLLPVAIYKSLFATVGLDSYWVFRALVVAVHLAVAVLIYRLAAPRVGRWGAVVAAVPILFLGRAWQDLLWAFQIGFVGSVALGLGALLALERGDRRGDALAALALGGSIACSSLGVPFAIGIAAELAWSRRWSRLWVVAAPAALYAVWYAGYGASTIEAGNIGPGLEWAVEAAAAAAGAVLGVGTGTGWLALAVVAALVAWTIARPAASNERLSPRIVGLFVAVLAFWALTGAARADVTPPDTSRYLYIGAVGIVLILVEALRSRDLGTPALAVAAAVASLGAVLGSDELRGGGRELRSITDVVRAELGALQLLGGRVKQDFRPDLRRAPQIFAGEYFAAVRRTGDSPADGTVEIQRAGGEARAEVDRMLIDAGTFLLQEVGDGAAGTMPPEIVMADGAVVTEGGCLILDAGTLEVVAPARGLLLRSGPGPAEIRFRRYFEEYQQISLTPLPARLSRALPASDAGPTARQVRIDSRSEVTACSLA